MKRNYSIVILLIFLIFTLPVSLPKRQENLSTQTLFLVVFHSPSPTPRP